MASNKSETEMETEEMVKRFLDEMKQKSEDYKFKAILSCSVKSDVIKWVDESGNDLMHLCILKNSPQAVECLLSNGYFIEPHQPDINPYSHLAAKLGLSTVLNILLNHRLSDNRPMNNLIYPSLKSECNLLQQKRETPLDIAAKAGNSKCIYLILTLCVIKAHPERAKSGYIALATLANSEEAVRVLLKEKPQKQEIMEAIDIAVHHAQPECLDLLLESGIDVKKLFNGVNFYHTLYSFSSVQTFGREGYARIPRVTEVLLKHKHDVKSKDPTNTYPLYSLIKNSLCLDNYTWTQYYLKCVQMLLKSGADPNFDEVQYERLQIKRSVKSIVGRSAYSSAIHCLLDTVESYAGTLDSKALAAKFVIEYAEILCHSDANINKIGRITQRNSVMGTVLHQFAKTSVQIGVDLDILKFFLRQGANADVNAHGKFVLNTFSDELFEKLKDHASHLKPVDRMPDVRRMLEICHHMSRSAIKGTLEVFKKDHAGNPPPQIKIYVGVISKELEYHLYHIKPLKKLVAQAVWLFCQRKANNVHQLPTTAKFKTQILPIS
ncbi:uncharacterized protein LOC133204736 [Saccostrea echinata]|uniref:uncharacterized protein LOC133204736 n=1 Tax=Saccostrea echinata TaxID=191078 RepID=UPI002A82AB5F|nr:uncharacterized protein LOC133204736 [Saccostrea echinata]